MMAVKSQSQSLLSQPAFITGDKAWRWQDVVRAGEVWGDWANIEAQVGRLTALALTAQPSEKAVAQAAERFRYERKLIAASELEAWLKRWHLTRDQWLRYIRMTLADQVPTNGGRSSGLPESHEADVVLTQAICSGELERLAHKLAERVAAAIALEQPLPAELDETTLSALDDALKRWIERGLSDTIIEREIESHPLEWTMLDCRRIESPSIAILEEVFLCVTKDNEDFEDVSNRAGLKLVTERLEIGAQPPALYEQLVSATPGEFIGPVALDDNRFWLGEILTRELPTADSSEIRARAKEELAQRRIDALIRDHIAWSDNGLPT